MKFRTDHYIRCILIVLAPLYLMGASAAYGEPTQIEIRKFVDDYAKQEGIDIISDPRLRGNVSLSSALTPGHISAEEFHAALLSHNFGAIKLEGTMRVVQIGVVKQHKLPFFDGKNRNGLVPSQIVTSVIELRAHSAENLVPKLRPLVPQWGYVTADAHTNALIVAATVDTVERLVELIDLID